MDTASGNNYTDAKQWIAHVIVCQYDAGGRLRNTLLRLAKRPMLLLTHSLRPRKNSAAREKLGAQTYNDQMKLWEAERDRAKSERRRPAWKKPKLGKLEASLPRPTLNDPEILEEGQQDGGSE
ncbi:hypothetical protein DFH29DRAFT_877147 [Suillus ampliporus]|nr:hypothetical protein DFH29DRAFT_877147 [Suillus ampliporus]